MAPSVTLTRGGSLLRHSPRRGARREAQFAGIDRLPRRRRRQPHTLPLARRLLRLTRHCLLGWLFNAFSGCFLLLAAAARATACCVIARSLVLTKLGRRQRRDKVALMATEASAFEDHDLADEAHEERSWAFVEKLS